MTNDLPPTSAISAASAVAFPRMRLGAGAGAEVADYSNGCRWIWIDDAARLAGITVGAMRNKCLGDLSDRALARKADRFGLDVWQVSEHADPRLKNFAGTPEERAAKFDWLAVPEPSRSVAQGRLAIVLAWMKMRARAAAQRKDEAAAEFLVKHPGVAPRTLDRWTAKFERAGCQGLLDGRRAGTKGGEDSPFADFWPLLEKWMLEEGEPSPTACYRLARAEARKLGLAIPSARSARRYAQMLKQTQLGRWTRARKGEKAFDDLCAASCLRDFTRIRVSENGQTIERDMRTHDLWVGDHHICDTLVSYKGKIIRPWLTGWLDIRSRKLIGRAFSPIEPDSSTVLLALRDGIIRAQMCRPEHAYTDNGKDYDAWFWDGKTKKERQQRIHIDNDLERFRGVYGLLGIKQLHARPFNPKAKCIEPFFGTFEEQFGVFTPTYTGGATHRKPERLKDVLKTNRVPTFEDYVAEATAWLDGAYHAQEHTGDGMGGRSPDEIYEQCLTVKNLLTMEALDVCLLRFAGGGKDGLKVGKNGLTFAGRNYGRGDPALRPLLGQKVIVAYDPADVTCCQVWHYAGQHRICTVQMTGREIFDTTDEPQYRAAYRKMQEHNKALAAVQARGMRRIDSPTELLVEDALAESRRRSAESPLPEPPTPTLRPVRTGFEGQSNDDHQMLRRAAGAEGMSPRGRGHGRGREHMERTISPTLAAFAEDD